MVISEIMLDTPSEWGGINSLEFIELYNSGLITEDLTGHRFSEEIDYTFPSGTTLAPLVTTVSMVPFSSETQRDSVFTTRAARLTT